MSQQKKAVIILSGGLDSTTCMGMAKEQGYELYPITFDYGQRHRNEIQNAREVSSFYGVADRHKIISLGFLGEFGGSALTDNTIDVPTGGLESSVIPVTYVPGRNLLFLSIAASYAEASGADAIYIGVNALDYSGYPDCRPDFIRKVEEVIAVATKTGVEGKKIEVVTPLIQLTKAEIIREGNRLGVPYHLTTSCYKGQDEACGVCDSCRLRLKGFSEAGSRDPIAYAGQYPQAMLFDLDGTLFKTETLLLPAYHRMFAQLREEGLYTKETPPERLILGSLGLLLADIWKNVLPGEPLEVHRRADELLLQYQIDGLKEGVGELYPGVAETLTKLREQGVRLFVASNGLEGYVKYVIEYKGLAPLFEGLYSAGEYQTASKVDLVRLLLDRHKISSAWMVGDRSSDVEAGVKNGLPVVGCKYADFGKPGELDGASAIITTFPALLDVRP